MEDARRALEAADRHLDIAVKDALAAGISIDEVAKALMEPQKP